MGSLVARPDRPTNDKTVRVILGQHVNDARRSADSAATVTRRLLASARRQTLLPVPVQPAVLVLGMEEIIRRIVGPEIEVAAQAGDCSWNVRC
jgi:hypothetical protein